MSLRLRAFLFLATVQDCFGVLKLFEHLPSLVESVSREHGLTFDHVSLYVDEDDELWDWANQRANFSSTLVISSLTSGMNLLTPSDSERRLRTDETRSLSIVLIGHDFPICDLGILISHIEMDYPNDEGWLLLPFNYARSSLDHLFDSLRVRIKYEL